MRDADYIHRLQAAARRQPFEPFAVNVPGGTQVTIDDPEAIAVRGNAAAYIDPQGNFTLIDSGGVRHVARASAESQPTLAVRKVLAALLGVHLLGIAGSVIAATVEIESIVGTGPAFSLLGLIVAECGRRHRSRGMFWIGMSTLALSLLVFALINIAEWGPADARVPVSVELLVYEALVVPAGLVTLWSLFLPAPALEGRLPRQFDLRSVLAFVSLLAIALAAGRVASDQGLSVLTAIAVGLLFGMLATLAWMARHGWRHWHSPAG